MRYEQPKTEMGANGIYGGVGSRPGREPWTPGGRRRRSVAEWVPPRLRRLRIHRTRPRAATTIGISTWFAVVVFAFVLFVILCLLRVV